MLAQIEEDMIRFSMAIENKVEQGNSYIESIVEYAQETGQDVEQLAMLINMNMLEQIRAEAEILKLVKRRETAIIEYEEDGTI